MGYEQDHALTAHTSDLHLTPLAGAGDGRAS